MNVLLIGECYSENIGDPLLCSTVEKTIKDRYPDASVMWFDLSGYIGFSERYDLLSKGMPFRVFLRTINRFPWLLKCINLNESIRADVEKHLRVAFALNDILNTVKIDLAVFAGGAIFMDFFAGVITCVVKKLNRKGIKTIFHACGMGGLTEDSIKMLQSALNCENVVSISLRDSYTRFKKLFQTNAIVSDTYDTAISCADYYEPAEKQQAEFGIGVIEGDEFCEMEKKVIEDFYHSSRSWRVFFNGSRRDKQYAIRILKEIGVKEEEIPQYLAKRPHNPDELIKVVTSFDKIVSFRMHSQIVATSFGVPSVGFVWDSKISQFYHKIGFPENAIRLDEYPGMEAITQRLEGMDKETIKNKAIFCGTESKAELLRNIRIALEKDEKI